MITFHHHHATKAPVRPQTAPSRRRAGAPAMSAAETYRARCATILRAPAAGPRRAQALALAFGTSVPAENAISVLGQMPFDGEASSKAAIPDAHGQLGAGVAAERARLLAILIHTAAAGRERAAEALAFDTDLDPEAALAQLRIAPCPAQHDPAALAAALGYGADDLGFGFDPGDAEPTRDDRADDAWAKALGKPVPAK